MQKSNNLLILKTLKAIADEEQSIFIDSKNISDEDLKEALLTVADIKVLCDDYKKEYNKEKVDNEIVEEK